MFELKGKKEIIGMYTEAKMGRGTVGLGKVATAENSGTSTKPAISSCLLNGWISKEKVKNSVNTMKKRVNYVKQWVVRVKKRVKPVRDY